MQGFKALRVGNDRNGNTYRINGAGDRLADQSAADGSHQKWIDPRPPGSGTAVEARPDIGVALWFERKRHSGAGARKQALAFLTVGKIFRDQQVEGALRRGRFHICLQCLKIGHAIFRRAREVGCR